MNDTQKKINIIFIMSIITFLFIGFCSYMILVKVNTVDSHLKLIYDQHNKKNITLDLFDTYAIRNTTGLKCDERYLVPCDNTDREIYLEFLGYTCYSKNVTCEVSK